jgi:hypothetical protein
MSLRIDSPWWVHLPLLVQLVGCSGETVSPGASPGTGGTTALMGGSGGATAALPACQSSGEGCKCEVANKELYRSCPGEFDSGDLLCCAGGGWPNQGTCNCQPIIKCGESSGTCLCGPEDTIRTIVADWQGKVGSLCSTSSECRYYEQLDICACGQELGTGSFVSVSACPSPLQKKPSCEAGTTKVTSCYSAPPAPSPIAGSGGSGGTGGNSTSGNGGSPGGSGGKGGSATAGEACEKYNFRYCGSKTYEQDKGKECFPGLDCFLINSFGDQRCSISCESDEDCNFAGLTGNCGYNKKFGNACQFSECK